MILVAKHAFKINKVIAEQQEDALPFTPSSVTFVSLPTEVSTQRKINLDHTPQCLGTQQGLDKGVKNTKTSFINIKVI